MINDSEKNKTKKKILWIGGTSGLTQTYVQAFNDADDCCWLIHGKEPNRPDWLPLSMEYVGCDLTRSRLPDIPSVDTIFISLRPPLVTHRTHAQAWKYAESMLRGLECLLNRLASEISLRRIIHVSSIAAVDHHPRQHLLSESDPSPASHELTNPYDRFKRATEELVLKFQSETCTATNLRFGAIFADNPVCIQCSSLSLQARAGPYLTTPIDCNSGRNAATLLHLALHDDDSKKWKPVYFYTRPLAYTSPVPYGAYLRDYREAYGINYFWTVPSWMVHGFVQMVHCFSSCIGRWIPYLQSIDYLLLVTLHEHSFDQSLVRNDFPALISREESILECFRRRRRLLSGYIRHS